MIRRKRFTLVSLVGMAVVLGLCLSLVSWNGKPGVTAANFQRLSPGMTTEETDAILGPGRNVGDNFRRWDGDGISVVVAVQDDEVVSIAGMGDVDTPYTTILGWLGRLSPPPPVPPSPAPMPAVTGE